VFDLFSRIGRVTTDLQFEPSRGMGPVGTGVHLLRQTDAPTGVSVGEAWLTFLFLPVIPFGEWTVDRGSPSSSCRLVRHVKRPSFWKSVAWVAGGALATLMSLAPAYCAITLFMGSKPAELAGLFSSAGAIIGTLGWLDQTRERVPFRIALHALARAATSPEEKSRE
jgi:hypothetical protein